MKKLTIIGKGAVGSLAVIHFLRYTDGTIDWIFDPNIPTTSVGEATNLTVPRNLQGSLNFSNYDLMNINGTLKSGISKKGGNETDYFHPFLAGSSAMHFEAQKLQEFIYNKVKDNPRITIKNENITEPEHLESDFVMVCSGAPSIINTDIFTKLDNIPVNSAYVTQCEWDYPKFQYSLTDAMLHGGVFGIPLQSRISIGYIYNDQFTTLDEVKEDVQKMFADYDLIPSDKITELHFESYYRKQNFTPKVVYNGNASFFLEPLEATSTHLAVEIIRDAWDLGHDHINIEDCQKKYEKEIQDIESMILLHYMSGSIYENDFGSHAQTLATNKITKEFQNDTDGSKFVASSLNDSDQINDRVFGTGGAYNYALNIKHLGVEQEITKLINSD